MRSGDGDKTNKQESVMDESREREENVHRQRVRKETRNTKNNSRHEGKMRKQAVRETRERMRGEKKEILGDKKKVGNMKG